MCFLSSNFFFSNEEMFTKVVLCLLVAVLCAGPARCLYTWQGFDHGWERRVLDLVETPHRLGPVANYLLFNEAAVNMTMTPGVSGDYAHPLTYYSQSNASSLVYQNFNYTWAFVDNATYSSTDKRFSSTNNRSTTIGISVPGAIVADATLAGWRLDMYCDPAKQPAGQTCNSDGVWPTRLLVDISACQFDTLSAVLTCKLDLALNRGWTPLLGGGRSFNYVMDFRFWAYVLVVGSSSAASSSSILTTRTPLVVDHNDIHEQPVEGLGKIVGTPGYPAGFVGLTGFGFEVTETDAFHELGRYLERLVFALPSYQYSPVDGSALYNYTVGFHAPITTLPSLANYWHRALLVQYQDVQQPQQAVASGNICINDKTTYFSCELHRLPAQTTTVVRLPLLA